MNPKLISGKRSPTSIFESGGTVQKHALGTSGYIEGVGVFYYALASATAMTIGEIQVSKAVVANHHNMAAVAASGAVGATKITGLTDGGTSGTVNQYREGTAVVSDGTGQGQVLKITGHALWTTTTVSDIHLADSVAIALDATSTVNLMPNLYYQPQQSNTTVAEVVAGVPRYTIAAAEYGWLQTAGVCSVLGEMTTTGAAIGANVTISPNTAGACEGIVAGAAEVTGVVIGQMYSTGVDTEYQSVLLDIRGLG